MIDDPGSSCYNQYVLVYTGCKEVGGVHMSLEEKLLKDFSTLPEDKKLEVIEFVEFLKSKNQTNIGLAERIKNPVITRILTMFRRNHVQGN